MSQLKDMYRTIVADGFPETMTITLGESVLTFQKRTWEMGGEVRFESQVTDIAVSNGKICAVTINEKEQIKNRCIG